MMECSKCGSKLPETAIYCAACGNDLAGRRDRASFAVKPDESVRSFRLVSSIMPTGANERPRTYQLALLLTAIATAISLALGWAPVAVMIAALAIPIVYITYVYDVNLWEDEPLPVTALAFVLTAALAAGFTLLWSRLWGTELTALNDEGGALPTVSGVLVAVLLVPVVGELIRQIGPVVLASRPAFDDLMDGLTFGIISGVAYSTADTLVRQWDLITAGFNAPGVDAAGWVSLLALEGFVKPLVIGTATGIACAEFSGLGAGYDGFTKRYFVAVGEAMLWNVLFFGGTYLLSLVGSAWVGLLLALVWGAVLLAALILRVRTVLQTGLLEAALESAARFGTEGFGAKGAVGADGDLAFCPACEMPLLPGSAFCAACGTAMRSTVAGHHQPVHAAASIEDSEAAR